MNYLLDTNLISEFAKPHSNHGVVAWMAETQAGATFLSVVTIAELRRGVERLPAGARREQLAAWLTERCFRTLVIAFCPWTWPWRKLGDSCWHAGNAWADPSDRWTG